MDIKIKIGGVEAVVTVRDATEAAEFLRSVATNDQSAAVHHRNPPGLRPIQLGLPSTADSSDSEENRGDVKEATPEQIRKVLDILAGSLAARLLFAMAGYENGVDNFTLVSDMSREYSWDSETNMGPVLSNISKASKRAGVPIEAIIHKRKKRLGKGKMAYFFVVKEPARSMVRSYPRFDEEIEFPISIPSALR